MATGASPSGLVTFLLTDVEGNTGLGERDEAGMADALARHDEVMRGVIAVHGGHVFSTAGDSFATPMEAVNAAVDAQRALVQVGLHVRIGIHMTRPMSATAPSSVPSSTGPRG